MHTILTGDNNIGPEGTKAIVHSLDGLTSLTTFDISNRLFIILFNLGCNSIEAEGAKAIAPALREFKLLTTLDISNYLHIHT